MIKKILFILFLFMAIIGFSQENLITKLSAAPNPFTTSTNISFTALENGIILFNVKNILGRSVHQKQLKIRKGENSISFYKEDLVPGIYIYTIQNKKNMFSKRLVIK